VRGERRCLGSHNEVTHRKEQKRLPWQWRAREMKINGRLPTGSKGTPGGKGFMCASPSQEMKQNHRDCECEDQCDRRSQSSKRLTNLKTRPRLTLWAESETTTKGGGKRKEDAETRGAFNAGGGWRPRSCKKVRQKVRNRAGHNPRCLPRVRA